MKLSRVEAAVWLMVFVSVVALIIGLNLHENILPELFAEIALILLGTLLGVAFIVISNRSERGLMHQLLQIEADDEHTVLILASNIFVPPGSAFTFNGRLGFGGNTIALEEYYSAVELTGFLDKDILSGFPPVFRERIQWLVPKAKPFRALFRVAPMDERAFERLDDQYGIKKPFTIITLGSLGSNWLTAYVSRYHRGWYEFDPKGDVIRVAQGRLKESHSLADHPDLGLIQRVKLTDENITIVILAGLSDRSTRMASEFFLADWERLAVEYGDDDFGVCLAVPGDDPSAYDRPIVVSKRPRKGD